METDFDTLSYLIKMILSLDASKLTHNTDLETFNEVFWEAPKGETPINPSAPKERTLIFAIKKPNDSWAINYDGKLIHQIPDGATPLTRKEFLEQKNKINRAGNDS